MRRLHPRRRGRRAHERGCRALPRSCRHSLNAVPECRSGGGSRHVRQADKEGAKIIVDRARGGDLQRGRGMLMLNLTDQNGHALTVDPRATDDDTLHQLADVLTDLAAESPPRIAGGLLVAARAMRAYAEGQWRRR